VTYDGPDLSEVAQRTGMTPESVIDIHCSREYRVYMLGFAPGFAYLGDLDQRLALPRRESPRKRVSKGSVAIAEAQTAVYPSSTPGGWHLIGRTEVTMFDPTRDPPATLAVGDRVRFERIGQ
jgi:KipI family sensor histidine kinase inhibitor